MESSAPNPCRHEFVRIYQRKLKGLDRRLVATKAYLPVGFKMTDFGHLSEGSYCFCTKCRARLFPKRTAADKAQARLAAQAKLAAGAAGIDAEALIDPDLLESVAELDETPEKPETSIAISVEELDIVALELEDLGDTKAEIPEEEEEEEV